MVKKSKEIVTIGVTYEGQTPKAYKVTPDGHVKSKWVPKSVSQLDPEEPERGADAELTIDSWFAEKEGLV